MEEVEKKIGKIQDIDLKGAVAELWSRMKTGSGGEQAMYGCFQLRMMDGLYKGNMPVRDGEDRIVMNVLRIIGIGARAMTNIYMDARMGEDVKKELRQTNMSGYYRMGGGKGADAPLDTCSTGIASNSGSSRNSVGKKKKKRQDRGPAVRIGGWIEADDGMWEWKPP